MKAHIGLAGRFTFEVERAGVRRKVAEFDNLITDVGMDQFGIGVFMSACRIGTGTTPPTNASSQLTAQAASTTTISSNSTGKTTVAPVYGYYRRTFSFAAGTLNGNYSEVGIGWSTTGDTLFSNSLIKDTGGSPTTITVLSTETLFVTYEIRLYAPTVDLTGTVDRNGNTHNWVSRACSAGWEGGVWSTPPQAYTAAFNINDPAAGDNSYNGGVESWGSGATLGPITGNPSGGSSHVYSWPNSYGDVTGYGAYVNGTYKRVFRCSGITTSFVHSDGLIGAIAAKTGRGKWQFSFDPPLPKTALDVFQMDFEVTWARY